MSRRAGNPGLSLLVVGVLLLTTCAGVLAYATAEVVRLYATVTRGVSYGPVAGMAAPPGSPYGVNVRLHEEPTEAGQRRLLAMAREGGYGWVRQPFPWAGIEPARGRYDWAAWDGIVALVQEQNLRLIAVLHTSPAWSRSNPIPTSPPDATGDYARFAGDLAARYRGRVAAYQIWDQPNISPHWGPRYASPSEYTLLLRAAAQAVRAADSQAVILAGGLAPTTEQSEWNLSDAVFLQGMYRVGARGTFDALAAKPYGFWTGPEDRRVESATLNFSRVILLREVMDRNGDAEKPIWAVEMGWNALSPGWQGLPSPWGSDSAERQADRTLRAVNRARTEWPWLPVLVLPALRYPLAVAEDPVRGFALLNDDLSPRPAFRTAVVALQGIGGADNPLPAFLLSLALLAGTLTLVGWRLVRLLPALPWEAWAGRFLAWPEAQQMTGVVLAALIFYLSPWLPVSLVAMLALAGLFYLRPDLGLYVTVFSVPFYLQPKRLWGSWESSMLEVLILVGTLAWLLRSRHVLVRYLLSPSTVARDLVSGLRPLDLPVLCLVGLGFLSLLASADVRLSLRELRTVILEPALLYVLIRSHAERSAAGAQRSRFVLALALALLGGGVAAGILGLYQYLFTAQVITAEGGLRRMLGPYPSPNALALFLERCLPLALALGLVAFTGPGADRLGSDGAVTGAPVTRSRRQLPWLAALATAVLVLGIALLLTFSVGAWMGAAVGYGLVAVAQPRRVAVGLAGLALVAGLLALPLLATERVAGHFSVQSANTTLVRVNVWQSAAAMIRDHPVQGVGLDGFLELYRTQYIRPEAWREPGLSHPHNLLLESWLSLGILGPVVMLWLLAAFFWQARSLHRSSNSPLVRALALGLAATLLAGVTHGTVDRFLVGAADLAAVLFLALASAAVLAADGGGSGTGQAPSPRAGIRAERMA